MRGQLEKALAEATAYANDIAQAKNDEALAEMKKSGKITFIELTPDQKAAWRKAVEPVYADMAARVGKDTIEEVRKEAGVATQ
jgi:C4-dicarboxylate-binding protein DctP